MTPEQIEAELIENERRDRESEEARRRRRAQIDAQFNAAYSTYTTTNWGSTATGTTIVSDWLDAQAFFAPPAMQPRLRQQVTELSLNERLQEAIQEADRRARRGDRLGHVTALQTANNLRRQIMNQVTEII